MTRRIASSYLGGPQRSAEPSQSVLRRPPSAEDLELRRLARRRRREKLRQARRIVLSVVAAVTIAAFAGYVTGTKVAPKPEEDTGGVAERLLDERLDDLIDELWRMEDAELLRR